MRFFELNPHLKSYKYPIAKIAIAIAIIAICIYRGHIFRIESAPISTVVTVICLIIGVLCILCIEISFCEIFQVHENRIEERNRNADAKTFGTKEYSVDEVVALAKTNDIIDMEVFHNGSIIKIGASSDCKNSDNEFFDKSYYIANFNYATIEEFESALKPLSEGSAVLLVISIDGVRTGTKGASLS